jgi:SSS family solute:Na+ symporter
MLQAFYMTVFCSIVFVVVSLLTPPPPRENIEGLTWEGPFAALAQPWEKGRLDPRAVAAVLCLVMVVLYAVLR